MVVGCSRKTSSSTTEVLDSLSVREVPRFIPVPIPGDTVEIERLIECDSTTNKPKPFIETKKSGRSTVTNKLDESGRLITRGSCDSLQLLVEAKDREIYRLRREKKTDETEYKKTGFDKFTNWWFAITAILAGGWIFYKLKHIFP